MKKFLILFVALFLPKAALANGPKSRTPGELKAMSVACSNQVSIADGIDCYERVIDSGVGVYLNSPYKYFGGEGNITSAKDGAKKMCELGGAFLPLAISGADQCLLEAWKAVANYVVDDLNAKPEDVVPFAPSIRN